MEIEVPMANGMEDLHEKNKDRDEKPRKSASKYSEWSHFQGHEDAEMLQEKSADWSSKKASRGDYDDWEE